MLTAVTAGVTATADAAVTFEVQSLDGSGNNRANPTWGQVGTPYSRVAAARYADGVGEQVGGPNSRVVSNRVFNDTSQNIFSERGVTQWAFVWGQFLDHTFGLRAVPATPETHNIPFDNGDQLEEFTNDLGVVPFARSAIAPGTGVGTPRQQINTVSSYIDAWAVYGGTQQRLEWLREGPVDGNMANNGARLLMPNNLLPRRDARGRAASAPAMEVDGRLRGNDSAAVTAGDVRANENIGLTATHTLFAREHNRIVGLLPNSLSEEDKFQIARKLVIAEQQYITYNEYLPAVGVNLPTYSGYNPNANANLGNEFATAAYRAHSMIHGEFEVESEVDRYSAAQLNMLRAQGVEIAVDGNEVELAVPLNVAFFNPALVGQIGLGPLLAGFGGEPQYDNDEQIDNQLRSVLFQVPVSGNPECLDGPTLPACFRGVLDLGAIDIERGRDHGMPTYNQLRRAFGLAPRTSFTAITGESSDAFPADPELTAGDEVNDPDSIDFVRLTDLFGSDVDPASDAAESAVVLAQRRTPLAARLRAIYGSVDSVDAFVGLIAERHQAGSEFGELQRAMWTQQFRALRDGDRFFYQNDPALTAIRNQYGIDFRRTLAQVIAANSDIPAADLAPNVFFDHGDVAPASCRIQYRVTAQWNGGFQVNLRITNTGNVPLDNWTVRLRFADGQSITQAWNAVPEQSESNVPLTNLPYNSVIRAGATIDGVGFNATWNNSTNTRPSAMSLNTTPCAVTS